MVTENTVAQKRAATKNSLRFSTLTAFIDLSSGKMATINHLPGVVNTTRQQKMLRRQKSSCQGPVSNRSAAEHKRVT